MQTKVPQKHLAPLIKMRMAGKRNDEIAQELGVKENTVSVYLAHLEDHLKSKFPERPGDYNGRRWTYEKLCGLAEFLKTHTHKQAAAKYNISETRIRLLSERHTNRWLDRLREGAA